MSSVALPFDAPPNSGMHPTADTTALIFVNRSWRRVTPGVMCLRIVSEVRTMWLEVAYEISRVNRAR